MILKAGKYYRCLVAAHCPAYELPNIVILPTRDLDTDARGASYRSVATSYHIVDAFSSNWSVHGGEEYEEVPDEEIVILRMAGKMVDTKRDSQ